LARLIWTAESRRWLKDIHQYIARDSAEAALKVVRGIFDRTHLLVEFPEMGHLYRPKKYPRVRMLLYGHYRILYRPEVNGDIHVLGVFHGALELRRHFKPKDERT
jgi:plasmid stabilization system protein ParE